jgi:hypothetical protein
VVLQGRREKHDPLKKRVLELTGAQKSAKGKLLVRPHNGHLWLSGHGVAAIL